ncbi:ABC transporter ATP-binding protein [Rhizobium daejeonense]|uniref:ABC transporter ATP-binding protein n=1 Tax=Rhizobium daejeonense TaxID=240521 RepID=A0A6M1S6G7_9HYPH|nr:ABC transporter ATP-binding protein [Rhizobium daejeonense]NGO65911.1 ABC transporter ATP-binding protein [Rhizobium daejeonense]
MTEKPGNAVEIDAITKSYGDTVAIRHVSMNVQDGEFVTILGPSGCGKSTLLRMISGFVEPTTGDLRIAGKSVVGLAPYKRDTAMVFQDYALFPHRTVAENIAFGLRMRKTEKKEIARRVDEMLELINLKGFGGRRVSEISGGQAQRVALGRALVVRPSVLLLDEPLGALDMKLRKQMQAELKKIHRELGLTFVAVTHDQEEALTLSDRIAVMNAGRVEQFDVPETLYRRPATRFVADFVGGANLIDAEIAAGGQLLVNGKPFTGIGAEVIGERKVGEKVSVVVRPETVSTSPSEGIANGPAIEATITEVLFSGAVQQVVGRFDDGSTIVAHEQALKPPPDRGSKAIFSWDGSLSWLVSR